MKFVHNLNMNKINQYLITKNLLTDDVTKTNKHLNVPTCIYAPLSTLWYNYFLKCVDNILFDCNIALNICGKQVAKQFIKCSADTIIPVFWEQ